MRGRWRPRLAAAAATVTASSATAVVEATATVVADPLTVIPVPSPPVGLPRCHFHTLPALQCRLHPTTPGGASPDPESVSNPYGRGGTGWVLRVNGNTAGVVIPYGAGTCATPLDDAFQLEYLAAPREIQREWDVAASPNVTTGEQVGAEFEWAGGGFQSTVDSRALHVDMSVTGVTTAEYFRPHWCASAGGHPGLVCADEVARLLTLHRNQWQGEVQRQSGLYDILGVSRVRLMRRKHSCCSGSPDPSAIASRSGHARPRKTSSPRRVNSLSVRSWCTHPAVRLWRYSEYTTAQRALYSLSMAFSAYDTDVGSSAGTPWSRHHFGVRRKHCDTSKCRGARNTKEHQAVGTRARLHRTCWSCTRRWATGMLGARTGPGSLLSADHSHSRCRDRCECVLRCVRID